MTKMIDIEDLKNKVLEGGLLSEEEAFRLCDIHDGQEGPLLDAAAEVTRRFCRPVFESCSILNARSGKCSENCKWCAQSAHYKTSAGVYGLVSREECMRVAGLNRQAGVRRFSLVTSGRAMRGEELDRACSYYRELAREGGLDLCASMGLLGAEELRQLREAGVSRYHCNLETAPSYFGSLCTTHTIEDKIRTIDLAHEAGMEVCSGGIIGMGETRRQRVEFALTLRRVAPCSIPLNILQPIPGTPLEHAEPLTDAEILRTVAMFRLIHPRVTLRFAGGRARLSREMQLEAIRVGVNGGIVGDLLTTIGSNVEQDRALASQAGYDF